MLQLILAILVVIVVTQAMRLYQLLPRAVLVRLISFAGGMVMLACAVIVMLQGKFELAALLGLSGFWILGKIQLPKRDFSSWGSVFSRGLVFPWQSAFTSGRAHHISHMRSAMIEMRIDHKTGARTGFILAGPDEGRSLDTFSRADCAALYRLCLQQDRHGAQLLKAYLDCRFPGWGIAAECEPDAGDHDRVRDWSSMHAAMSEDEAYEILGLRWGATRDEISRAHRSLMKKFHPDYGGSTDLAARVNEARDVLMRRHY